MSQAKETKTRKSPARYELTTDEIRQLQRSLGLTADGILGPQTLKVALEKYRSGPTDVSSETMELLQSAAFQADPGGDFESLVRPAWLFYSNAALDDPWVEGLQLGTTIFWIHGRYPRGGSYKRRLRAGDTVVLLVGQCIVASGVLLADERFHFYDSQDRVRRPVRVFQRYSTPLDRGALESAIGQRAVRQGSVHPLPWEGVLWLKEQHAAMDVSPLPYEDGALEFALSERSLAEDLRGEGASLGIRPDEATASALAWEGEPWRPGVLTEQMPPAPDGEIVEEPEPEDEGVGTGGSPGTAGDDEADIDVQIPFVLDAPADTEDDLDRGPFALFLARRLHLIWCQVNGHAPGSRAAPPDSDTFIAHVDSPWGGGKSTFANFIARVLDPRGEKLTPKHFLRSSLAPTMPEAELPAVPLHEVFVPPFATAEKGDRARWPGARRPWIVARYNAWRDQFVQPPWWQIFLTLHEAVTREVWQEAMVDLDARRDWAAVKGIGRTFRAHLALFSYRVWNAKLQTQLGLLVLVAVLAGLVWSSGIDISEDWLKSAVAIIGVGGASLATFFTVLSQSLSPDLDFTSEHKQIGVRDPISRFRKAFGRILGATDRPVLLIVDDLDRCEPRTVVEIMRGFQTIIRSPRLFVLLLGDRAWIEGAHDVYHKDQLALQGGESSLGSLYVRKVIQLSFRLPVMKAESRRRFARRVLGEQDEATAEVVAPVLETFEQEARQVVAGSASIGGKEAALDRLKEKASLKFANLPERQRVAAMSAVSEIASTQVVAAAGADTAQQREVFNAITRLVDCLPNNPRQIKRIFMAFATYEQVGRRLFDYRLTPPADEGDKGTTKARRWRQLAMWVTLAVEWPETWRAVARHPGLLAAAYGDPEGDQTVRDAALLKEAPKGDRPGLVTVLQRLRTDPSLIALLSADQAATGAAANDFARTAMEADAIYEFNRIIWEPGFVLRPDNGE